MGSFQKVSKGDLWAPNAEKENAITDVLNAFSGPREILENPYIMRTDFLKVMNSTDKQIDFRQAVQVDTSFVPDDSFRLNHRNIYAFGRPVENEYSPWGIAQENIRPGHWGFVQMTGVALLYNPLGIFEREYLNSGPVPRWVRNSYIFAGRDGQYHFGQRGGAEVIWYNKRSNTVLVRLGVHAYQYTGMFAVLENGDGTLTVRGGETDLHPSYTELPSYGGGTSINDTVIKAEGTSERGRLILLAARLEEGRWHLEIVSTPDPREYYVPGEKIYWELARYSCVDRYGYIENFQQIWQGGVINFRDRYYIQ